MWCSSVSSKVLWRMFCYVPPVTYFHQKSTMTTKTEHLGRFRPSPLVRMFVWWVQYISWGVGGGGIQYGDENGLSPGSRNNLAMKSVLRNAVLDDNILFLLSLCWNPLKCLPTAISQNLVLISYGQGIMTHVERCSLVTHFSPEIDNNDFEDETYEPIFFFWHEPSRTAMHHSPH